MTTYKIDKYELQLGDYQTFEIEGLVKVLNIVKQYGDAVMYVLVDAERKEYNKRMVIDVRTISTNHEIKKDDLFSDILTYDYINTVSFPPDEIMFHYFARKRDPVSGAGA